MLLITQEDMVAAVEETMEEEEATAGDNCKMRNINLDISLGRLRLMSFLIIHSIYHTQPIYLCI